MIIGTIKADKESAIRSETPARIFETGAYKGKIRQAEQYETKNGAAMLRFYFESNEGAAAWLSLCIVKSDGEEAFGMGIFQSMLFCSQTESVEWVEGKVRTMKGEIVKGYRGKAIEGKPIGLVLEAEPREYLYLGEVKIANDMIIRRAFDPATGRTAKEIDSGATEATAIPAFLKNLKEHPKAVRKLDGGTQTQTTSPASMPPDPPVDDDMPF